MQAMFGVGAQLACALGRRRATPLHIACKQANNLDHEFENTP